MSDARIKYEQVVIQFDPSGVRDEALQAADPGDPLPVERAKLQAVNLTVTTDDGASTLDGARFSVELPKRIAIVGADRGGQGPI